jgi:hypothetical protein
LLKDLLTQQRMEQGLQPFQLPSPLCRGLKNKVGYLAPIQLTVLVQNERSPAILQSLQDFWSAIRIVDHGIGIDPFCTEILKSPTDKALAAGNPANNSNQFHDRSVGEDSVGEKKEARVGRGNGWSSNHRLRQNPQENRQETHGAATVCSQDFGRNANRIVASAFLGWKDAICRETQRFEEINRSPPATGLTGAECCVTVV